MDQKNLDIYGSAAIPWSRPRDLLDAVGETTGHGSHTFFLTTASREGRPHVAAVGALWVDGKLYFTSGARTRKSRDLAKNPRCVVSVALKGLDLVIEGTAAKVTDAATLERLAKRYEAQGWPAKASGSAITAEYSAPSAGPPPWDLWVVTPLTAFGVATEEPWGATRWRFDR